MDDAVILKQKKRKVAIDPDQDEEDTAKFVTTKTVEESAERSNYDHKPNGGKASEPKKQPEKKEEAKPAKSDSKPAPASKPKATPEKDNKANVKKDTDQKPPAKPKAEASAVEKKPETNGQVKKKPAEERKTPSKSVQMPTRKKVESSDDEDESSESESDSEEDSDSEEEVKKKKKRPTPVKKERAKPMTKPPEGNRKSKDTLVYDVLKRWWYCMPDWPPAGYDYTPKLREKKLRKVDQKFFRAERELDENGNHKVYELPSYQGVFKNSQGENIDLRPHDSCPSYENLKSKGITELCELLVKALKNQTSELEKSPYCDTLLLKGLQTDLARAEKSLEVQKSRK